MRGRAVALLAVLVVVQALAQAGLVWVAPRDPFDAASLLLAAVSALVVLASAAAAWALAAAATGAPGRVAARAAWTVAVLAVVTAAATVLPPIAVVLAAAGCPALAAGGMRDGLRLLRRHPGRSALLGLANVLVVVLAWVGSALAGLLLGGAPGSFVSWLTYGLALAVFATAWCRLAARPRPIAHART
ncbi:MAG: hypothetical protein QM626_02060 [Microbacterium sp.]|uniref:hypothetical protein n=1 Tax=Microbacterium sp. TaxID=51671 RepID=UPI0039E5AC49